MRPASLRSASSFLRGDLAEKRQCQVPAATTGRPASRRNARRASGSPAVAGTVRGTERKTGGANWT